MHLFTPPAVTHHPVTLPNGFAFRLVYVEGGRFMMGSDDEDSYPDERPPHPVTVPDLYLAEFPVTQELWEAVHRS